MGLRDRSRATPLPKWEDKETDLRFRRDGDSVVCEDGALLPERCVACNLPTKGQGAYMRVRLDSRDELLSHRAMVLLLVVTLHFGHLHHLLSLPPAEIWYGLCEDHRRRRLGARVVLWTGIAWAASMFFLRWREWMLVSPGRPNGLPPGPWLAWSLPGIALAAYGAWLVRREYPRLLDRYEELRLEVSREFLESLPRQ